MLKLNRLKQKMWNVRCGAAVLIAACLTLMLPSLGRAEGGSHGGGDLSGGGSHGGGAPSDGGSHGGGGDALVCDLNSMRPETMSESAWTTKRIYFADTFESLYGNEAVLARTVKGRESQIREALIQVLDDSSPGLGEQIREKLDLVDFVGVDQLEELDNDNIEIRNLPSGCSKVQLAVQDFELSRVRVRRDLYADLTDAERAIFQVHEALIGIRGTSEDTTPIRKQVEAAYRSEAFKAALVRVEDADRSRELTGDRKVGWVRARILEASVEVFGSDSGVGDWDSPRAMEALKDRSNESIMRWAGSLQTRLAAEGASPTLGPAVVGAIFFGESPAATTGELAERLASVLKTLPLENEKILRLK